MLNVPGSTLVGPVPCGSEGSDRIEVISELVAPEREQALVVSHVLDALNADEVVEVVVEGIVVGVVNVVAFRNRFAASAVAPELSMEVGLFVRRQRLPR